MNYYEKQVFRSAISKYGEINQNGAERRPGAEAPE